MLLVLYGQISAIVEKQVPNAKVIYYICVIVISGFKTGASDFLKISYAWSNLMVQILVFELFGRKWFRKLLRSLRKKEQTIMVYFVWQRACIHIWYVIFF